MNPKNTTEPAPVAVRITLSEELLRAGKALGSVITPPAGFAPYAIVPPEYKLEPVPRLPLPPLEDHIRQNVRLLDAGSFVGYVKAFRTPATRIFAAAVELTELSPDNAGGAELVARLDYHHGGDTPAAARCGHVARYPVNLSLEFSVWLAKSGKAMSQMDFVSFIEANCVDVQSPSSAALMELALNFESKTEAQFQSKVNRVTGGRELVFQERVEAGAPSVGQVKVPEGLTLSIPVFEGGKVYEFNARMEYRASGGRLAITFHLQRPHVVFREAWKELRALIAEALETEILTGEVAYK